MPQAGRPHRQPVGFPATEGPIVLAQVSPVACGDIGRQDPAMVRCWVVKGSTTGQVDGSGGAGIGWEYTKTWTAGSSTSMAGSSETEPWSRWPSATACQTAPMASPVDALIFEYTRRYVAGDADGVSELCETPFLAIREGRRIHLSDPDAVREHFAQHISAYRAAGYASFAPIALQVRHLGDRAAFVTVRWHALDGANHVVRDSFTTYHVIAGENGWRFLSYTNHF